MSSYEQKKSPVTKTLTIIKEEQTSSDESQTKQNVKVQRHRASVACVSCRDRRIRCVLPPGEKACIQCERSSTLCIIKNDDERRRPISRAYVYSLVERVALLEHMLEDEGLPVPPANHPPETRHRSGRQQHTCRSYSTPSSSSTPHNSSTSDHHTTSSPSNYDRHIKSEPHTPNSKKRSSIFFDINIKNDHAKKRTKNDSLTEPTDVKVESSDQSPNNATLQYSGLQDLDHLAVLPPPNSTSLWPIMHEQTNTSDPFYSALRNMNSSFSTFNAWHDTTFELYSNPSSNLRYRDTVDIEQRNGSSNVRTHTNLDFMPLSINS